MRLLFDQNLSFKLVPQLDDAFPGSAHVRERGLDQASDDDVWLFARDGGYCVTSKDGDFSDEDRFPGPPPKYLQLTIGNASTSQVEAFIRDRLDVIRAFESDDRRALVLQ